MTAPVVYTANPLISVDEIKLRWRIKNADSDELLGALLRDAIAAVETWLGRIIWQDPNGPPRTFGNVRADYPVLQGLRVTDTWPNNRYDVAVTYDDYGRAQNIPAPVVVASPGPLSDLPDFLRLCAICNQAIADTMADVYFRPNSMVLIEREAGVEESYGRLIHGLPARVRAYLMPIKNLSTVSGMM